MNHAVVNVRAQVFVWTYVFISLGNTPRSGTAGSNDNSMFNLLRTCRTVFQTGCTNFYSHQKCRGVGISS